MSAIAKRYAQAAYDAVAEKAGEKAGAAADGVAADVQRFVAAYADSPELREVLRNPVLKEGRVKLLEAILAKQQVSGVAAKLIGLLAANDRVDILPEVAQDLEHLADRRAGRLRAQVRSAVLPSADQQKRIARALEKRLGQPVVVSVQVDPTLLGGMVCQVGDLTLDSSLKRQLEILTERLGAHA